jgi:hypothetical protein
MPNDESIFPTFSRALHIFSPMMLGAHPLPSEVRPKISHVIAFAVRSEPARHRWQGERADTIPSYDSWRPKVFTGFVLCEFVFWLARRTD